MILTIFSHLLFGKHRKSIDNPTGLPLKCDSEVKTEVDKAEMERLAAARRQQQEDHDRMQEQYRRMIETTARSSQQQQSHIRGEELEPSRSERMHQLRAEHQRRHAQRNRTYPTDDIEEQYESAIRQRLDPVPSEPKPDVRHIRSHSYDVYGDSVGRPGSRTGYADPHKYSHYVNYEQIQQHLRKNKEQERLKKLANQQYKDFRDKQSRDICDDLDIFHDCHPYLLSCSLLPLSVSTRLTLTGKGSIPAQYFNHIYYHKNHLNWVSVLLTMQFLSPYTIDLCYSINNRRQLENNNNTHPGNLLHKLEETFIHESVLARYYSHAVLNA
ncbi:hypothetical protein SK128_021088 [Halocaridina rubra]|uniref:Uncharacterized protein n=1 Tax=Halocaridina rubra TaxID=373956 RepID=A0AAN9FUF2_HALRR